MFSEGVVIYVLRNPIELFYSAYRQGLVNLINMQSQALTETGQFVPPISADEGFEGEWKRYAKFGGGFFAMINLHKLRKAFERHFTFETIEFDLIKISPPAFVAAFTRACGNEMALTLTHTNRAERDVIEEALATLPHSVPETLRNRYRENYEFSRLSRSREDFLRNWEYSAVFEEFAAAFRI